MNRDKERRRLPTWREMNMDTAPWAEKLQFKAFRETPAWRKLEMSGDLTKSMICLAESGLRSRNPQSSPAQIRRLLADTLLGSELAERVYGGSDAID